MYYKYEGQFSDHCSTVIRYNELQRKVVGITATMLTKDLRELENDGLISRKQYSTIPPTVEYSLTEKGKTLIPALDTLYQWADDQMKAKLSIYIVHKYFARIVSALP